LVITFFCFVAVAFGIVTSAPVYCLIIPGFVLGLYYLYGAYRRVFVQKDVLTLMIQGCILSVFLLYMLLRGEASFFYHALSDLSLLFSGTAGAFIRRPIAMGVTYGGVDIVCLFLVAFAAAGWMCREKAPLKYVAWLVGVFAIWGMYMALWTVLAENSIALGLNRLEPVTGPLDYRLLLFAMLLTAYIPAYNRMRIHKAGAKAKAETKNEAETDVIQGKMSRAGNANNASNAGKASNAGNADMARNAGKADSADKASNVGKADSAGKADKAGNVLAAGKRGRIAIAVLTALCLSLYLLSLVMSPKAPATTVGRRVVFWDSGLDFTVPADGRYGLDQVGMFGVLPDYLEVTGYVCDISSWIDADILETADVLVVINPMTTPDQESLEAIRNFVRRGGGLLAAGDHTGDRQIRLPLNAILEPAGIAFNFDSAIPFQNLWPDALMTRRSPIFANVSKQQIQTVVGASLEIAYGARPLLIGKTGYSDAGDPDNAEDGFLGDMRFSRGERVGDLILAAESRYGMGKILAFGDTSFLQNTTLAYSYPLIDNLFAYLAENDSETDSGQAADSRISAASGQAADSGLSAASGQTAASGSTVASGPPVPAASVYAPTCLIDAGHMPSFKIDKSGDAADGFIASVLRAGMIPYVSRSSELSRGIEKTRNLKLVALVEPASALAEEDMLALRNFVENGGAIMLFGTYRSPEATRSLFARFGFSFENLPIGRVSPAQDPEMAFWNACPLLYQEPPAAYAPETESLVEIWGYEVVVRQKIGQGKVYAFGDGDFIKNKNLESVDAYRKGNIDFIGALLRDIV
jgi:hypothetical protein